MQIKVSVIQCFCFVFFIIFTLIFHIVAINHCKSVKSIDNNLYNKITDAEHKQKYIPLMLAKTKKYGVTTKRMTSIRRWHDVATPYKPRVNVVSTLN